MAALHPAPRHRDLVFDVGLHGGEDTEFYLSKGFRVVAVEANPDLARSGRDRFRAEIARGRLILVEGAIVDPALLAAGQRTVLFYRNDQNSAWGTLCDDWVERNRRLGTSVTLLEVPTVDFAGLLRTHGIPYYMKIDIEGCDMICVEALRGFQERPAYLSIESDKTSFGRIRREIEALCELGYDRFQAVEQSRIYQTQSPPNPAREGLYVPRDFELGCSGLFGDELEGRWRTKRSILRLYRAIRVGYYLLAEAGVLHRIKGRPGWFVRGVARRLVRIFTRASVPGWYDTHARHSTAGAAGRFEPIEQAVKAHMTVESPDVSAPS